MEGCYILWGRGTGRFYKCRGMCEGYGRGGGVKIYGNTVVEVMDLVNNGTTYIKK